jgi:ribose/xylose/arabinose/galactoside ABC-type transport system permease subunit
MKGKILGIFTVLVVLCTYLAFATANPWWDLSTSKFLNPGNIQNLLNRLSLFGILGIGVAFVIITSGIDLSIGSTVCLAGVLLSILLKVDYQPAEQISVAKVVAAERLIVVEGTSSEFKPGSTVRFTGGVGSGLVLTVDAASVANDTTEIRVTETLSRNEAEGRLSIATPVIQFSGTEPAAVDISSASGVEAGDQLQFVKADGAVTLQKVTSVSAAGETVTATLAKDPGEKYRSDSFAIVLKRHQRTSIPVAITIVLLVATGLGLIHGLLITRVKLQPFPDG